MKYQNITVAGSGVLGSQIAYQIAFKGFKVSVYEINNESLEIAKNRIIQLKTQYQDDLEVSEDTVNRAFNRISFYNDLSKAVSNADLVIECIPEVIDIKMDFYKKLGKLAPKHTIFATNSSTLLPSQLAKATGRPEKFLALHFANEIWIHNTAEIMKHPDTDEQVFEDIIEFAKTIGMVALPLYKEQAGYILNSLLVPFLKAANQLLVRGIADAETIDKTWMVGIGTSLGPFAILDIIGINTVYNIISAQAQETGNLEQQSMADLLKMAYIEEGKLGVETGKGFYTYPHPEFMKKDFLKN